MTTEQQFFTDHPEHRDGVMKAFYAYHTTHFSDHPDAHDFPSTLRCSECTRCGRSREMVRWDDLPAKCSESKGSESVESTILAEERKFSALLKKAEAMVPKIVEKRGMSGDTLAFLHFTHGFDPETVAGIVDVPREMMKQYHENLERERAISRSSHRKEIITIQ